MTIHPHYELLRFLGRCNRPTVWNVWLFAAGCVETDLILDSFRTIAGYAILFSPALLLWAWYLPEQRELLSDLLHGTSPLQRCEDDRQLEGRLFAPACQFTRFHNDRRTV